MVYGICRFVAIPFCLTHFYTIIYRYTLMLYTCLDPAPPWNLNKIGATLYYPRHYRKFGLYKFTPRYPMLRTQHVWLLISLFLHTSNCYNMPHSTHMKLRHTSWGSSTPPPWSLTTWMSTTTRRTNDPPNDDASDGWGSSSHSTFQLDQFDVSNIFPTNYDPSHIVKIFQFLPARELLTYHDAPIFYNIVQQQTHGYSTHAPEHTPLIVDTGASV